VSHITHILHPILKEGKRVGSLLSTGHDPGLSYAKIQKKLVSSKIVIFVKNMLNEKG
jgi:hypothetical protein